jgi:hypothetical protein
MRYDMRLRKVGLGKKMRFFLLVIVGLLMALSVYNVYRVFGEPEMINKNVPVYNFQHQGEMDYRVQLKPNTIISETEMHQDEVYYSKLVESIDTDFSYSYTADQPAKLKVIYDVVAVVEAPEMWKKEFPLIPETVVEEEGKTVSFNRPFSFNLEPYQNYVSKANEELGVNARDPEVIVQANINVVAESAAGQSSEKLTPSMEIPLSAGEFKIGGTLSPEKSGVHTAAKMVPNPGLQGRMTRHVLFLGILIVFGAITLLWTEVKEQCAQQRKITACLLPPHDPGEIIEQSLNCIFDKALKASRHFLHFAGGYNKEHRQYSHNRPHCCHIPCYINAKYRKQDFCFFHLIKYPFLSVLQDPCNRSSLYQGLFLFFQGCFLLSLYSFTI